MKWGCLRQWGLCRGLGLKLWLLGLSLAYYGEIGQQVVAARFNDRGFGEQISFTRRLSKLGSISGLVASSSVCCLLWPERLVGIAVL